MMRGKGVGVLLLVAIMASTAIWTPVSVARAQISIGAFPSILQLSAAPGATGQETVRISNSAPTSLILSVAVESYAGLDDKYSATDWVSIAAEQLEVPAESDAPLVVDLLVPNDAATGGAYARIVLTSISVDGQPSAIAAQIVIGVFFEVQADEGELTHEVSAGRVAATLENDGRVGFRGEVTNEGNVLTPVTGSMELTSTSSEEMTAAIDLEGTIVFPTVTSVIASEGTLPLPAGSEWTAVTQIYPGDPEQNEDLEPIEVESTFTVNPQLGVMASICENLDRGPTVTLDLNNTGTIALIPEVSMALVDASGTLIASINQDQGTLAWPGEHTLTPIEGIGQLQGGDYMLRVTANIVQGLDPIVTEVPFSIGGFGDNVAPLCGSEPAATPDE
jgi:hypothetical protein